MTGNGNYFIGKLAVVMILFAIAGGMSLQAQERRVSPVKKNTNKIMTATENDAKVKELKAQGLVMMGDSIVSDSVAALRNDSIKIKRMQYPLLTSVTIGANIWDPAMRLFGQKYGGMDFSAELSLWNRINPIVEVGFGMADDTPDDKNYTYKSDFALYGKIGCNYNFSYNSKPDYLAMAGFRLGYSNFKYSITDVEMNPGYWDEETHYSITDEKSHALWGELIFTLRVRLYENLSAGWSFKYHFLFNYKKNENSVPWYIPGYGTRTSPITAGFSLYYTLPLNKDKWPKGKEDVDIYTGEPHEQGGAVTIPGPGSSGR